MFLLFPADRSIELTDAPLKSAVSARAFLSVGDADRERPVEDAGARHDDGVDPLSSRRE